jgi:hypothetical protein
MKKPLIVFALTTLSVSVLLFSLFAQSETITVTTYYPSPYGSYRNLTWGNFPNSRGMLIDSQGSSIELGGSGTPFIDFSNDMASNFDFRFILNANDELEITGGEVTFSNDTGTPATLKVGEVWYCTQF